MPILLLGPGDVTINNQILLLRNIYLKYSRKKLKRNRYTGGKCKGENQGNGRGRVGGQGGGSK